MERGRILFHDSNNPAAAVNAIVPIDANRLMLIIMRDQAPVTKLLDVDVAVNNKDTDLADINRIPPFNEDLVSIVMGKERAYAVMYGKISRIWRIPLPIRNRVRIFTREERKRWSEALPILKNYTVSVIAECGGFLRLPNRACSLPPCRIGRRSPTYAGGIPPISSRFSFSLAKNKAYLVSEIDFVRNLRSLTEICFLKRLCHCI